MSASAAVERKPGPLGEDILPILFDHCKVVYKAMFTRAEKRYADDSETDAMLVYEGHLTRLFSEELRLSVPYYSSVMKELKRMGCVRQLRRGGGNSSSQWELIREPEEELFRTSREAVPSKTKIEVVKQQVSDINSRLLRVEQALGLVSE